MFFLIGTLSMNLHVAMSRGSSIFSTVWYLRASANCLAPLAKIRADLGRWCVFCCRLNWNSKGNEFRVWFYTCILYICYKWVRLLCVSLLRYKWVRLLCFSLLRYKWVRLLCFSNDPWSVAHLELGQGWGAKGIWRYLKACCLYTQERHCVRNISITLAPFQNCLRYKILCVWFCWFYTHIVSAGKKKTSGEHPPFASMVFRLETSV